MFEGLAQTAQEFGVLTRDGLIEFEPGWVTAVPLRIRERSTVG
jgi:hypothetical protein